MKKILYLLSHPIQYQSPLIESISLEKKIKFKVLYESIFSLKKNYDREFNKNIKYDVDLISNYEFDFINKKKKINFFIYLSKVKKILNDFKPDFVWIHGYESIRKIIVIIICKFLKIKVLIRGESNLTGKGNFYVFTRAILFTFLNLFVFRYMAIGKKNYHFYCKFINKNKISLFPYVVDNNFFQKKVSQNKIDELLKKYKIKSDTLVFLYSGKLIKKKNVQILIESFKELKIKNSILFIVGDGSEMRRLKKRFTQKNIIFKGFVNQSNLVELYNLSKIFILPSKYEPWGLSVNEAMNCKNALILSSNVGCGADLLKKNFNGFLFKNDNKIDLKMKILKIISNKKKLRIMMENSKKIIDRWDINYSKRLFLKIIDK